MEHCCYFLLLTLFPLHSLAGYRYGVLVSRKDAERHECIFSHIDTQGCFLFSGREQTLKKQALVKQKPRLRNVTPPDQVAQATPSPPARVSISNLIWKLMGCVLGRFKQKPYAKKTPLCLKPVYTVLDGKGTGMHLISY